jgi:glucosamine--fructose-6-phosphate aminotransferase (isomerizing)
MKTNSGDIPKLPENLQKILKIPLPQLMDLALDKLMHQGEMVANTIESVRGQLDDVVGATSPERIYLVGCGDSLSAALSARRAFEQLTGLPTVALESMECARYTLLPPGSLVIWVSTTGEVNMTLEAGRAARQSGVDVIGVTAEKESRIAQEFPCLVFNPGLSDPAHLAYMTFIFCNFSFSLATLYLIALHIGSSRGHLDDRRAGKIEAEITEIPDAIAQTVNCSAAVREYVEGVSEEADFYFLGTGPSYGVARFLQAKFFEQVQHPAYAVELEEFPHEWSFLLKPGEDAQVWFIVPPGPSQERALEIMAGYQVMGPRVVAVTTSRDVQMREKADLIVPVEAASEMFSPLVSVVPGELLAIHAFRRWRSESFSASNRARYMAISMGLTRRRKPR